MTNGPELQLVNEPDCNRPSDRDFHHRSLRGKGGGAEMRWGGGGGGDGLLDVQIADALSPMAVKLSPHTGKHMFS